MIRSTLVAAVVMVLAGRAAADDRKLVVKAEAAPPPQELAAPVRGLLDGTALTVSDGQGKLLCTIWPRKELPSKADAAKAKAGLTYADFDESLIVGAVKFPQVWTDFRKQKIQPGVYTLRLGKQPMDGDHMGTAPYDDFCLLCPAKQDTKPDLLETKPLQELSSLSTTRKHPGVMLTFPNPMPADAPTTEAKQNDIWVVNYKRPATASGQPAVMGFSLVLIGQSMAE
ncbi:MAG TPA: hypothetical protein VGF55_07735 [Gemmataceae bacterium]|jgi:hypothetical protein